MFYSHEILTSRKYGVATVWLVATLGANSGATKKVTRKAILNVDVQKACGTIMEPEAPMALRLQSNLLYGVSRVYDQQCLYVLQDAQTAQAAIRALNKSLRVNHLDLDTGKAKPEQLMIMDDPAFLPDEALPALEFDFSHIEIPNGDTQRSSQSLMSLRDRSGSVVSPHGSMVALNIPSSGNSSFLSHNNDPFQPSSSQKPGEANYGFGSAGAYFRDEEPLAMDDDFDFGFGPDGELRDFPESMMQAIKDDGSRTIVRASISAASGSVRQELPHPRLATVLDGDGDWNMAFGDDDMRVLPDSEPFAIMNEGISMMSGGLGGNDKPQYHPLNDLVYSNRPSSSSSVSAKAPQRRKRDKKPRLILADQALELSHSQLKSLALNYLDNMEKSRITKRNHKMAVQAKHNAFHYIYGTGINGIGEGIGSDRRASPLAMFAGHLLYGTVTGEPLSAPKNKNGTKRVATEDTYSQSPKRTRESGTGQGNLYLGGDFTDDGGMLMMMDGEHSVEVGRDAPSALPDHPSSAMMPWNVSASLHSYQRAASSSIQGGRAGLLGSVTGKRLTSASPLVGKGSTLPGELETFSLLHEKDQSSVYGGHENDFGSRSLDFGRGVLGARSSSQASAQHSHLIHENDELEMFAHPANVEAQTAASSQGLRNAPDKESKNFFEYLRNTIDERFDDDLAAEEVSDSEKHVTFEELFMAEVNTKIVAAQAFYHILCLATQNRIKVRQDLKEGEDANGETFPQPWGAIHIGIVVTHSV